MIYLKKLQVDFLIEHVNELNLKNYFLRALDNQRIKMGDYLTDKYLIELSVSDRKKLLHELTSLLITLGLNPDDSITKQGLIIEDIIDLLDDK